MPLKRKRTRLAEYPFNDVINNARPILEVWKANLDKLEEDINDIFDAINYRRKAEKEIEVIEAEISKKYVVRQVEYTIVRGKL